MTPDEIRKHLLDLAAWCETRCDFNNPWGLWAQACHEAAEDLQLLIPKATPPCPTCGEPYERCQCEKPF